MTIVEKQGLAALTYESLAAESGLSKSGLIYYFPSRQTLLLEINQFLAAQWEEKMVELAGGPAHEVDKRERIRASFLVMSQSATLADLRMTLDAADNPEMLQPWLDVMARWSASPDDSDHYLLQIIGRPMGSRPYQRVLPITSAAATIHSASTHVVSPRSWVKCLS